MVGVERDKRGRKASVKSVELGNYVPPLISTLPPNNKGAEAGDVTEEKKIGRSWRKTKIVLWESRLLLLGKHKKCRHLAISSGLRRRLLSPVVVVMEVVVCLSREAGWLGWEKLWKSNFLFSFSGFLLLVSTSNSFQVNCK